MFTIIFTRILLCFLLWPKIITTSTPTKPHILGLVPGSEFSGGFPGHLLLVRNVAFDPQRRVKFRFVWLFEGLYLFPCYQCRYSGPVELREVGCRIAVCAGHHAWPEPSFCKFTRGPVLIVDTNTQLPSSILLDESHTDVSSRLVFVVGPHFFRSCRCPLHVFRLPLKLSDGSRQQLLPTHFGTVSACVVDDITP